MYKTILLAYDGSREERLALREGAQVVLLAVVDLGVSITMAGTAGAGAAQLQIEDFHSVLDEGLERLPQMGRASRAAGNRRTGGLYRRSRHRDRGRSGGRRPSPPEHD